MNRLCFATVLFFLMFSLCLMVDARAEALRADRDVIIDREMDCIARHSQGNTDLTWSDVCYTNEDAASKKSERDQKVARTLDDVAREHTQYWNDQENPPQPPQPTAQPVRAPQRVVKISKNTREDTRHDYIDDLEDSDDAGPSQQDRRSDESSMNDNSYALKIKRHETELGAEIYHTIYRERIFNLKTKGTMYGIHASHAVRLNEQDGLYSNVINMYKIDGRFAYGLVNYSSSGSGTLDHIDDYVLETRAVVGKDFY